MVLSLTKEQEEVNKSLSVGKVFSEKLRTRSFFTLITVLSLHKRAFQCPDVMEIENRGIARDTKEAAVQSVRTGMSRHPVR